MKTIARFIAQVTHSENAPTEARVSFSVDAITNDTAIVTIGDCLDFRNASDLKVILKDQILLGTRKFILDFSGTKSFDSTGLGSLFAVYRQLAPLSGMICFASTSGTVKNAVQMTRSYKVFPQFRTVETAKKSVVRGSDSNRVNVLQKF